MKNFLINLLNVDFLQKTFMSYKSSSPRVVFYHLVSNKPQVPYYYKNKLFNEDLLEDQIKWYIKNGFKFISLEEATSLIEHHEKAKKMIAFTTDDGFRENYDKIAPIFQKYQIKATFFLISCCVDNNDMMWNNKVYLIKNNITAQKELEICRELKGKYSLETTADSIIQQSESWPMHLKDQIINDAWSLTNLPPLKEYLDKNKPYMTNNQVQELLEQGHKIGSHSATHPDFSRLSKDEILSEMISSKEALNKAFNADIKYFAFPYGIRPSKAIEEEIFKKNIYKLYFGTKNNLSNDKDTKVWERDKMEQRQEISRIWFSAVPVIRHIVLHPLGKYK